MKALVTGSAGFIGGHVAAALEQASWSVTGADIETGTDVRRLPVASYDLVVHCAAVVGGRRVVELAPLEHAANLAIDASLFEWAAVSQPGRVVYFSSSCAYPAKLSSTPGRLQEAEIDPYSPRWPDELYGWTKLTGELVAGVAADAGIPVSIVRPFSVYGPGMKDGFAITSFTDQIRRRADPVEIWGPGTQVRDFIHVRDVARAVLAMAEQGIDGPVNLGTGRGTSLVNLVHMMGDAAGYGPAVCTQKGMPAGLPCLVADPSLLRSFCAPAVKLEDYFAEVLA